ncbi:hypothetical protein P7K49_012742, partial [Saguinus oedipus]
LGTRWSLGWRLPPTPDPGAGGLRRARSPRPFPQDLNPQADKREAAAAPFLG